MNIQDLVIPPPSPKVFDYPSSIGVGLATIFTILLVIIVGKFDASGGILTISLLVTVSFLGVVAFCVFFTIPGNEITSAIIGGLTAAFGAVVAHWIGRNGGPPSKKGGSE